MPESKEKSNKIETKGLSNILAEAQGDFVKNDLDALKKRMNFAASLDSINLKELPKENELKNFEGFQWEVVHLAAYLIRKLNFPIDSVKNLHKSSINKDLLPPKLQLVYARVQELGKVGLVSPVYGKIFDKWEDNVTQYIQPHAQNILKVYDEDTILDSLPAQLKNLNPVTGTILGGGLALAYWAIKKFTGEKDESFGLGKMLAMTFGGAVIGSVPALKNLVTNNQYVQDWSKKIFGKAKDETTVQIEITDSSTTKEAEDHQLQKLNIDNKAPVETREKQLNEAYDEAAKRLFGSNLSKFPSNTNKGEFKKLIMSIVKLETGGTYHPRITNKYSALGLGQMLLGSISGYIANTTSDSYKFGVKPQFDANPRHKDIREARDPGNYDGTFGKRVGGTGYYMNMSPVDQLQVIMYNHLGLVTQYSGEKYKNTGYTPYQLSAMAWFSGEGGLESFLSKKKVTTDAFGTTPDSYAKLTKKNMEHFSNLA